MAAQDALFDLDDVFEADDYCYFYSEALTEQRSDAEVAFWAEALELRSPMTILDIPCGFGRHSNRLAALGYAVTGIDRSAGFLDMARRRAAELGVHVDYRQGDMRDALFTEEFDRAVMLFTSLGYFEDEGNLRVLQNLARALKPGGLLGFDVPNRDSRANNPATVHVVDKEGNLLIDRMAFDMQTGRMHTQRTSVRDGIRRDKHFYVRLYNSTEIRDLVGRAGLRLRAMLGDEGRLLTPDSRRLLIVAEKATTS